MQPIATGHTTNYAQSMDVADSTNASVLTTWCYTLSFRLMIMPSVTRLLKTSPKGPNSVSVRTKTSNKNFMGDLATLLIAWRRLFRSIVKLLRAYFRPNKVCFLFVDNNCRQADKTSWINFSEEKNDIQLTGLALPHFCACPVVFFLCSMISVDR